MKLFSKLLIFFRLFLIFLSVFFWSFAFVFESLFFVFSSFLFSAKWLRFLCESTRFFVYLIRFWSESTCFFVFSNMILKILFFICFFFISVEIVSSFSFFFKTRFYFLTDFDDADFISNRFFVMIRIAKSKKIATILTIFSFFLILSLNWHLQSCFRQFVIFCIDDVFLNVCVFFWNYDLKCVFDVDNFRIFRRVFFVVKFYIVNNYVFLFLAILISNFDRSFYFKKSVVDQIFEQKICWSKIKTNVVFKV